MRFCAAHPCVNIGKHLFERFKPFFVWRMKDRNIHVEIDELWTTFNNMLKAIHGSNCTCDCQIYVSTSMFVVRLAMKCFLESPRYGKTLCARKMSLCNDIRLFIQ